MHIARMTMNSNIYYMAAKIAQQVYKGYKKDRAYHTVRTERGRLWQHRTVT